MIESLSFAGAAARARVIAAALAAGRSLDLWSLAMVTLALLSLLWMSLPLLSKICLLISISAGSIQKIFALRVSFDEAIFRHWVETWTSAVTQGLDATLLEADLATLDHALASCGLRVPADGAVRNLDSRLRGAWKLLRRQALALGIQLVAMVGAAVVMCLLPAG